MNEIYAFRINIFKNNENVPDYSRWNYGIALYNIVDVVRVTKLCDRQLQNYFLYHHGTGVTCTYRDMHDFWQMALNVYLNKDKNEKEERVTVRRRLVKNIDDSGLSKHNKQSKDNKKEKKIKQ